MQEAFCTPDTVEGTCSLLPLLLSDSSFSILSCISCNPILTVHEKGTIFRSVWFIPSSETAPKRTKMSTPANAVYKDYIHNSSAPLTHMFNSLVSFSLSILIGTECSSVLNEPGLVQISLWYCRWRWGLTSSPTWLCSHFLCLYSGHTGRWVF